MIKIGGVEMPEPKFQGLKITKEKIWSKNTGRTTTGETVGDIVAVKTKLEISFPPLSEAEVEKLDAAITPAFFQVYFRDPTIRGYVTKTMYAGTPSYPVYSYARGVPDYAGVAVNLIEK